MTDSLETPESMAEPWKPSATAVPQRVGKRPAPFTTVLVLTVEHSKHIDGLAALIESRISCMDGVLDVESQPHDAGPVESKPEHRAWVVEGDELVAMLQSRSLTFAFGFSIGSWWADRPWRASAEGGAA